MRCLSRLGAAVFFAGLGPACSGTPPAAAPDPVPAADDLLVVDCLLPGEIRKLGSKLVFAGPRRPVKTSAADCEIRGGEYVAYDRADYRTALEVWQAAAEAGDPEAENYVGEIYEKGLGVAPDHALAAAWYQRAAEQGYSRAQTNLGQLYDRGLGVPHDPKQAVALYGRASGLEQTGVPFLPAAPPAPANAALERQLAERTREAEALRQELRRLEQQAVSAEGSRRQGEYELNAERAKLDEARRQLDEEQRRLAEDREQLARDHAHLEHERTGASTTQEELERLAATLGEEEAKVARQSDELIAHERALEEEAAELARRRQENVARDSALSDREQSLEEKSRALEALETELARLRREAERTPPASASAEVIELPGPSIELIEPPLPPMRGVQVVAAAGGVDSPERLIVGRVEAPAGLMAFTINAAQTPVDERGLFRTSVRVPSDGVLLRLAAIDRRGKRAERELRLEPAPVAEAAVVAPPERPTIDFGTYYALVIGNDDYQALPDLRTAVNDARAVASILQTRYGFRVQLLANATRYQVVSALNELRANLTEKDNLLIYYAGHGELDQVNSRGHWLPVDAEPSSNANWISNVAVTDVLNAMAARHVLVVADSCYSGSLTRSSLARLEAGMTEEAREAWIRAMVGKRSRTALTSGGLQPVLDSGGGGRHSIFARILLEVLQTNQAVLEGQRLFQEVSARVTWVAEGTDFEQVPQYAPVRFAGHESGEFFLVPSS